MPDNTVVKKRPPIVPQDTSSASTTGSGSGGSTGAAPMAPPPTPTPETAYGDSFTGSNWKQALPWGEHPPARPGPQSWFDWFSKSYHPSASDVATQYGDAFTYHLAPLASRLAQAGGAPVPSSVSPEAIRAQTRTAAENLGPAGPVYSAAGYATSPLTYFGVGPLSRVVGGAAKFLPEAATNYVSENVARKAIEGGTASALTGGAYSAGQGDSPRDIALNAAANIPVGAVIGGGVAKLPFGATTPADVTQSTADAASAAEAAKANITIPRKGLGFTVSAGPGKWDTDPSLSQVNELKDFLTNQEPGQGQDILLKRINQQTTSPVIQQADEAVQKAQKQAQWAQTLERWGSNQDLPGAVGDVRAQAAEAAQNYPPGAPENATLQQIARAPDPPDRVVSPNVRRALIGGGGALGEGVGFYTGLPHGGTVGSNLGNEAANLADWMFTPSGANPKLQAQIQQSYPALTGQQVGPGGNEALTNALLRLYGAGVQPAGQ